MAAEQETVSRSAALLVLKCTRQLAGVIGTISSHRAGGLPHFPHPLQRTVARIARSGLLLLLPLDSSSPSFF